MCTRRAADELMDVLKRRPNARVLILETLEGDIEPIQSEVLTALVRARIGVTGPFVNVGKERGHQVLTVDVAYYQKHKSRLGVIDVVIVDNRHNVARVDREKKFKSIETAVRKFYPNADWITVGPDTPPLGVERLPPATWQCGDAITLRGRPFPLVAQAEYTEPCGARNPQYARYCRECGRFRGIEYV